MNYLKEVIIRVDFPNVFDFSNKEIPSDISKDILKIFPIPEPRTIQGAELRFSNKEEFTRKELEKKEWHFFNIDRTTEFIVTENALMILYKKYEKFDTLNKDWNAIMDIFFNKYSEMQANRIGLRYINQINLEKDSKKWKNVINEKLLCNFQLGFKGVSRSFGIVSQNENGVKLNFQYGMHNADYPLPIKDNLFTLDFDVFCEGFLTKKEIVDYTKTFHNKIKKIFKMSLAKKNAKK